MSDTLHADVVVVGIGAGGATIAGEALREGRSVVLVQAGPLNAGRPGYNVRNDQIAEDSLGAVGEVVYSQLVNRGLEGLPGAQDAPAVGGLMRLWFNNCPTPDAPERNSAIPAPDMEGLLARARRLLHVRTDTGDGSVRQARLIERLGARFTGLPEGREVQPMPVAVRIDGGQPYFVGADDLLLGEADEMPSSATWMTESIARRILHSGGRITGIEVYPVAGGGPRTVTADTYVIAAGTLGTTQLLLASQLDCGEALGRYLMDHALVAARVPFAPELLAGVPDDDPSFTAWLPYSEPRPWHAQVTRTPVFPDSLEHRARDTGDLLTFCGTEPRPENRITIGDELDDYGLPRLVAELTLSETDRSMLGDAIRDQWMITSAFGDIREGWAPQLLPLGAGTHLMGTHRMGSDPATSVTDSYSRVWAYDNLYLAGNGLFSERNAGNPTLQTVCFALRAADHMLGRTHEAVSTSPG